MTQDVMEDIIGKVLQEVMEEMMGEMTKFGRRVDVRHTKSPGSSVSLPHIHRGSLMPANWIRPKCAPETLMCAMTDLMCAHDRVNKRQ